MKQPEEIKKGLAACSADECHGQHEGCTYQDQFFCTMRMCGDSLAYIQRLENAVEFYCNKNQMLYAEIAKLKSRLAQVERERDAAVEDFTQFVNYGEHECKLCRHREEVCLNCTWEWRGVKRNDE